MSYWQSKAVLVTGGSRGLGRAMGRALARRGAGVALLAREPARLEAAADELRAAGSNALALAADATKPDQVEEAVRRAVAHFGRLDALIHCAGRSARGEALATTPELVRELLEINFLSAVHCARAASPHLLAARGHLVTIGSLASKAAGRWLAAYPAAKHALAAYTQQLRLELSPRGLHVLLVCPGPIARSEPDDRYGDAADVPETARRPGGGVRLAGIDPDLLAERIVRACERRQPELVVPWRARLLFALAQLAPRLGDWIIRRMTDRAADD